MIFGLKQTDLDFIKENLKKVLTSNTKVWCFGSRARGDHQKFSDLDLMIESNNDQRSNISKLNEVFEESNLPIKVDIVHEKDFAKSYFKNYLSERILFLSQIHE